MKFNLILLIIFLSLFNIFNSCSAQNPTNLADIQDLISRNYDFSSVINNHHTNHNAINPCSDNPNIGFKYCSVTNSTIISMSSYSGVCIKLIDIKPNEIYSCAVSDIEGGVPILKQVDYDNAAKQNIVITEADTGHIAFNTNKMVDKHKNGTVVFNLEIGFNPGKAQIQCKTLSKTSIN